MTCARLLWRAFDISSQPTADNPSDQTWCLLPLLIVFSF
jgi:hypothetical protein